MMIKKATCMMHSTKCDMHYLEGSKSICRKKFYVVEAHCYVYDNMLICLTSFIASKLKLELNEAKQIDGKSLPNTLFFDFHTKIF